MEGLVVVEKGDDAQTHRAQQEHSVPPHFHPGRGGKKIKRESCQTNVKNNACSGIF